MKKIIRYLIFVLWLIIGYTITEFYDPRAYILYLIGSIFYYLYWDLHEEKIKYNREDIELVKDNLEYGLKYSDVSDNNNRIELYITSETAKNLLNFINTYYKE